MIQGTKTVSREIATFDTPREVDVESLRVHFSPQQEGEGDPSPSNVRNIVPYDGVTVSRSGKNMANIYGYSAATIVNPQVSRVLTNKYGTSINTVNFTGPDTELVITQSQWPNSTINHYQNGYFAIGIKGLVFGQRYNFSFKVTNITNNPLNASLNDIKLSTPYGSQVGATEVRNNVIIYKNVLYRRSDSDPNEEDVSIRNCGMSFTLSNFMVTAASETDFTWEPYAGNIYPIEFSKTGKNLFDISEMATRSGVTVSGDTFSGTAAAISGYENG